jgi:tetratricopeptide (TPR) repeat protein
VIELLLEGERAMSFGRLDRAEEIYQQVVASDPHNSIAVVGLARVALERGDDLGSYRLARQALGIDPENDAARRMAVRLEEVLATRGQPVDDPMPRMPGAPPPASAVPAAPVDADAPGGPVPPQRRSIIDRLRHR